jgi:hypothetical protein
MDTIKMAEEIDQHHRRFFWLLLPRQLGGEQLMSASIAK